jgi:preprotein translocase subunit SecE
MGRIQRKKSSAAKKKKKQATGGQATAGAGVARKPDAKKAVSGAEPAKAAARKKPSSAKKQPTGTSLSPVRPKDNIFTKTAQFLREVKVELKKVAWPTRKQTIGSTAVVIALVMLISLFLGVVDFGISSLIRIVLQ